MRSVLGQWSSLLQRSWISLLKYTLYMYMYIPLIFYLQYIEKIAMAQDHVKSVQKQFCKPFHFCNDRIVLQIPTIHDKNGWSLLPLAEENSVSILL